MVTVAAAVAAAFEPVSITGFPATDALCSVLFAVALVEATSRSRRWSWMYLAGATTTVAPSLEIGVLGVIALGVAFWATASDRRDRVVGAVIGALCSLVQLRLDLPEPEGLSALVVAAIAVPVLVSGWRVAPRRVKRPLRRALLVGAVAGLVAVVGFAVVGVMAAIEVTSAMASAQDGIDAARDGEADDAAEHLRGAQESFDRAHTLVGGWWAAPARAVPIVGLNAEALVVATAAGGRLTGAAAGTAEEVDLDALSTAAGTIDLQVLAGFSEPLHGASDEIELAAAEMDEVAGLLIAPPLAAKLDELSERIDEVAPEAELAAEVIDVAPALLGGGGVRRYFVAFVQPAEARAGGGFLGNWAELTATDGTIEMTRHGRVNELLAKPEQEVRTLTGPPDYLERYGGLRTQYWVQDIPISPNFPSVAEVFRQVYPQTDGGAEIDGVLRLDPYALAALLELTGPIEIDGYPKRLTSRNAAQVLLRDQYLEFSDRSKRADFLGEASRVAFDQLLESPLPSPRAAADALDQVVDEGRLTFWTFEPDEQALFERVGVDGALPLPTTQDFLSVRHQNSANNKIDSYLDRSISYEAEVDPRTGGIDATVRIRLENRAPSSGLPDAIIGDNDKGLALGTNFMYISVYTPHELRGASVDEEPVAPSSERELGHRVYTVPINIPAGEERTLELRLEGQLLPGNDYRLTLSPQQLVQPDRVSVTLKGAGSWSIRGPELAATGGEDGERIVGLTLDVEQVVEGRWRRDGNG